MDPSDEALDRLALVIEIRRCRKLAREMLLLIESAVGEAAEDDKVWKLARDIARPEPQKSSLRVPLSKEPPIRG